MKRIGIQLFCVLLCMTLLTACGQTPPVLDESLPQDVSTTTSTLDDTTATTDEGADVTDESADATDTTTPDATTATTDEGADVTDESADTTDTATQDDATTTKGEDKVATTKKAETTTTTATTTKKAETTITTATTTKVTTTTTVTTTTRYRLDLSTTTKPQATCACGLPLHTTTRGSQNGSTTSRTTLVPPYPSYTTKLRDDVYTSTSEDETTTITSTTTTTTAIDPEAPPADRQEMNLRFDGQVCTLEYYATTWDKESGRKQWQYREINITAPHPLSCTVDAETERIVYMGQSIRRSFSVVMGESELRDFFRQKYTESKLGSVHLYKAEYCIDVNAMGTDTGTVTIKLNDAGDTVKWTIVKLDQIYLGSVSLILADPNVYPDELANFYVPNWC